MNDKQFVIETLDKYGEERPEVVATFDDLDDALFAADMLSTCSSRYVRLCRVGAIGKEVKR